MIRTILSFIASLAIAAPAIAQSRPGDDVERRAPQTDAHADVPADSSAGAGMFASWDTRARLRFGVARIRLRDDDAAVYPIYLTINYRISTNALPSEPRSLRLGVGAEVGVFYLYPYAMLGPELRYGDFYLEGHGGATFVFLVGSDTPGGSGAALGGASIGWIVGSDDMVHLEIQAGADAIKLLAGKHSTAVMPHVTVAFRF